MDNTPLSLIVEKAAGKITNLGLPDVDNLLEEIGRVQGVLGFEIPCGYKDFLLKYGSAEIFGDELFSIYGEEAQDIPCGDLIYQYRWYTSKDILSLNSLPFLATNQGKVFYFKCNSNDPESVYVLLGDRHEAYASSFLQFLERYTI